MSYSQTRVTRSNLILSETTAHLALHHWCLLCTRCLRTTKVHTERAMHVNTYTHTRTHTQTYTHTHKGQSTHAKEIHTLHLTMITQLVPPATPRLPLPSSFSDLSSFLIGGSDGQWVQLFRQIEHKGSLCAPILQFFLTLFNRGLRRVSGWPWLNSETPNHV